MYLKFTYFEKESERVLVHAEGVGQRERGRERIPGKLHAVSTKPHLRFDLMNHEIMT